MYHKNVRELDERDFPSWFEIKNHVTVVSLYRTLTTVEVWCVLGTRTVTFNTREV